MAFRGSSLAGKRVTGKSLGCGGSFLPTDSRVDPPGAGVIHSLLEGVNIALTH